MFLFEPVGVREPAQRITDPKNRVISTRPKLYACELRHVKAETDLLEEDCDHVNLGISIRGGEKTTIQAETRGSSYIVSAPENCSQQKQYISKNQDSDAILCYALKNRFIQRMRNPQR